MGEATIPAADGSRRGWSVGVSDRCVDGRVVDETTPPDPVTGTGAVLAEAARHSLRAGLCIHIHHRTLQSSARA